MADKIRGITIELGGDTSGLSKALKNVNTEIDDTQKQLKDVERLLKLDPKNTELLAQKQKLLGNQIQNTTKKLDSLKEAQATMDKNGVDKNSDQYMALQREIISTEREVKNLNKASKDTAAAMSSIGQAAQKVADGAQKAADKTKVLSGAAGGALTAIGGMAYKAVTSADDLNTLAKQTGFSTDELQKFQYASDLVDVSMGDITGAATKLKKAISSDSKELAALGVQTKNADGSMRDMSDVFYETLAALGNIKNETERDAAAMAIFGKSADSLAGIIDDGGAALKSYGAEAEDLGLILSQDTLDGLNEVNDEIDRLKAQATATLLKEGAAAMQTLEPILEKVLGHVTNFVHWLGSLNETQLSTIMTILAVVAAISPLASVIAKVSGLVAKLPALIQGVSAALLWLKANPLAAVIGAIAVLVLIIAAKGDEIQAFLANFNAWLQGVFAKDWSEVFGPVLGGILNGFFSAVKTIWDMVYGVFNGVIDFIRGVFTNDWERAWNGVKGIFSSIMSGLASVFKRPLNAVVGMINSIIDGINWLIRNINSLGSILGFSIGTIGHIPMLASGGVLTQGSAIVGEAGPEILTMQGGKAVVQPLTEQTTQATQRVDDRPIVIKVQSVLDGRVISESVTKYQGRAARANG